MDVNILKCLCAVFRVAGLKSSPLLLPWMCLLRSCAASLDQLKGLL